LYNDEQARFGDLLNDTGIPETGGDDLRQLSKSISRKLQ
jgi:hypothetical protein